MSQENLSRLPTETLARLLMECAKQDPALVGRPRPITAGKPAGRRQEAPDARLQPTLPADRVLAINVQFEELTSVVVESAGQAEEALRLAHAATRSARRGMAVFAGIGVLGIVVGVAGTAKTDHRGAADTAQREIAAGGHDTPAQQGETVQVTATETAGSVVPAGTTEPPAPISPPPVYHGPIGTAAPWQAYRPPVRRIATEGTRPPATARFVATIRRDVRAFFQAFPR